MTLWTDRMAFARDVGDYFRVPVLHVDCAYPGEFAEACLGVTAQDHPPSLRRVSGDDQVVCPAWGSVPADMGEQAPMMGRCRLRVVKDVNGGRYRDQCPSAFGCPASRISQFDPDTEVPRDPAQIQFSSGGPCRILVIAPAGSPRHQPSASTHQVRPAWW